MTASRCNCSELFKSILPCLTFVCFVPFGSLGFLCVETVMLENLPTMPYSSDDNSSLLVGALVEAPLVKTQIFHARKALFETVGGPFSSDMRRVSKDFVPASPSNRTTDSPRRIGCSLFRIQPPGQTPPFHRNVDPTLPLQTTTQLRTLHTTTHPQQEMLAADATHNSNTWFRILDGATKTSRLLQPIFPRMLMCMLPS